MRSHKNDFRHRVYWLCKQIPVGELATYGQLSFLAGKPRAARAVGTVLRHSLTDHVSIPWHRVINARGCISHKGDCERAEIQLHLLIAEGIVFNERGQCDLLRYQWSPDEIYWGLE